jgi:hypothetical protein
MQAWIGNGSHVCAELGDNDLLTLIDGEERLGDEHPQGYKNHDHTKKHPFHRVALPD